MNIEQQYISLLGSILAVGDLRDDRTGVGTRSIFGYQMRHHLSHGFPLLTTKKVHFKSALGELLWFLNGCKGGIKGLRDDYGITIWDEWLELEKAGKQLPYVNMVRWGKDGDAINQLQNVIDEIKSNPYSRRLLVLNWNPKQVHHYKNLVLPACHVLFQFYVAKGRLSCQMYQRSTDVFLGLPFNIASYALLTHMVAQVCDLEVGELIWTGGDTHLYSNHIDQVKEQLTREPRDLPTIRLNPAVKDIFEFQYEDFTLENYKPYPTIKAPIAI